MENGANIGSNTIFTFTDETNNFHIKSSIASHEHLIKL